MMKSFLKPSKGSVSPVTIDEYNRELDEAMERVSRGEFTTLEALEKEMQTCKKETGSRHLFCIYVLEEKYLLFE